MVSAHAYDEFVSKMKEYVDKKHNPEWECKECHAQIYQAD